MSSPAQHPYNSTWLISCPEPGFEPVTDHVYESEALGGVGDVSCAWYPAGVTVGSCGGGVPPKNPKIACASMIVTRPEPSESHVNLLPRTLHIRVPSTGFDAGKR